MPYSRPSITLNSEGNPQWTHFFSDEEIAEGITNYNEKCIDEERKRLVKCVLDNEDADLEQKDDFISQLGWDDLIPDVEYTVTLKVKLPAVSPPIENVFTTGFHYEIPNHINLELIYLLNKMFPNNENFSLECVSDHPDQVSQGFDFYRSGCYLNSTVDGETKESNNG